MLAGSQAAAGTRKGRLGDSSVLKISEDVDLEPHQPGLLWVTSLNPEAGKLGLVKVYNKAVVPGGRP